MRDLIHTNKQAKISMTLVYHVGTLTAYLCYTEILTSVLVCVSTRMACQFQNVT